MIDTITNSDSIGEDIPSGADDASEPDDQDTISIGPSTSKESCSLEDRSAGIVITLSSAQYNSEELLSFAVECRTLILNDRSTRSNGSSIRSGVG